MIGGAQHMIVISKSPEHVKVWADLDLAVHLGVKTGR